MGSESFELNLPASPYLLIQRGNNRSACFFATDRYVQYINRTYRRSGTLWEGRVRSCLIEAASSLLADFSPMAVRGEDEAQNAV